MDDPGNYDLEEELVAVIPSQQNWKGIGISLLVILSVIGLVAFAVFCMTPPDAGPRIRGARIALDNFTSSIFDAIPFNATWVSDHEMAFMNWKDDLILYDALTRSQSVLVNSNVFRTVNSKAFSLSPDLEWILIKHHQETTAFRHRAQYSLQEIKKGINSPLIRVGVSANISWGAQERLDYVTWAGGPGCLVLVKDNNLYHTVAPNSKEIVQVTDDGVDGVVFNGVPDWLYRERILHRDSTIWVSPDRQSFVYATINSSQVSSFRLPHMAQQDLNLKQDLSIKYAKSGGPIPLISLYLYHIPARNKTVIQPPQPLSSSVHYVEDVGWLSDRQLSVTWLTRSQDLRIHTICTVPHLTCSQVNSMSVSVPGRETLEPSPSGAASFNMESSQMVLTVPVHTNHGLSNVLMLKSLTSDSMDTEGSNSMTQLTFPPMDVDRVIQWDHNSQRIYFLGSPSGENNSRHLYTLNLTEPSHELLKNPVRWQCITCSSGCNSSDIYLSRGNRYYIQHCLGPGVPSSRVLDTATGEVIANLSLNEELKANLKRFSKFVVKTMQVNISRTESATVRLKLPPGFREYEEYTFPLVLYFRSGFPSGLSGEWEYDWSSYLSSSRDYIVAEVSLPGCDLDRWTGKGQNKERLRASCHNSLLAVYRYLATEVHYVDSGKVGLVGEGEGGYTAGMLLHQDVSSVNPISKCAVLVSPIVDWRLQDVFLAENYFGSRSDMEVWTRYDSSSLARFAGIFPSKRVLLTNRPGDLLQLDHLLRLSRALIEAGVLFRQQVYVEDSNDASAKYHFYKSLDSHLADCFGPVEDYFRDDYFLATLEDMTVYT